MDSYLMRTLRAPRGVTTVAGAKRYATKLATSPAPTVVGRERERGTQGKSEKPVVSKHLKVFHC